MLLSYLTFQATEIIQGKYYTLNATTEMQQFQFNATNERAGVWLSFIYEGNSQIDFKACASSDPTSGKCSTVDLRTITSQGIYQIQVQTEPLENEEEESQDPQENFTGTVFLYIININASENIKFEVDNAELVYQYEEYQFRDTNGFSFLYFSCNNNSIQFNFTEEVSGRTQIYFYFTRLHEGFVDSTTCTENITGQQICGITADSLPAANQPFTLEPGLWYGVAESAQGGNSQLGMFIQTPIINLTNDAVYQNLTLSSINFCKTYVNISLQDYFDLDEQGEAEYIESLFILARHKNQVIDGGVQADVYTDVPFDHTNPIGSYAQGILSLSEMEFKRLYADKDKPYFFLSLGQANSQFIHAQNWNTTEAEIMIEYNIKEGQVGVFSQSTIFTLTPITPGETNRTKIEQGTRRYGFNFYYDLPSYSRIINLVNSSQITAKQHYTFFAVTPQSYDLEQQVNIERIDGREVTTQLPLITDEGTVGTYIQLQATTENDLSQNKIKLSEVAFQEIQVYEQSSQSGQKQEYMTLRDGQQALLLSGATEILEVDADTEIQYNNYNTSNNAIQLIINPNDRIAESEQYIINATKCSDDDVIYAYWSWQNILVNRYLYKDMDNTTLTNSQQLVIQAENTIDPLYLNIRHKKKCLTDLRLQIRSKIDVETVEEGQVVNVTVPAGENVVYEVALKQLLSKGSDMYLRAELTDLAQTSKVGIAVTNQLYYGNASDANVDILLTLQFLDSSNGIDDVLKEFMNKNQEFVYITFTNHQQTDAQLRFFLSQPVVLTNDQPTVLKQRGTTQIAARYERRNNYTQEINVVVPEGQSQFQAYICPYSIPFYGEYESCQEQIITSNITLNLDEFSQIGYDYLIFDLPTGNYVEFILVESIIMQINSPYTVDIIGETPKFFQVETPTQKPSYTMLRLYQCENCYICASDTIEHPAFSIINQDANQCKAVVANMTNKGDIEVPDEWFYNTTNEYTYIGLYSLNPLGKSQQVIFEVYQLYHVDADQQEDISFTEQSSFNGYIQLNKTDNLSEYVSIMFAPSGNVYSSMYFTPRFNIYVTRSQKISTFDSADYSISGQQGSPVLTIKTEDLFGNETQVNLSIRLEALENSINPPSGTIAGRILIGFGNKTLTVNNELFAESFTASGDVNTSIISVYNVSFQPTTILLEKCQGNPHIKVGTNDFFAQVPIDSNETSYDNKTIYYPTNETDEYQYITLSSSQAINQQLLIQTYSTEGNFEGKLIASTYDIRPGTPISTQRVMKDNDDAVLRVHPAVDYTRYSTLEYAMFAIKYHDTQDERHLHPNPQTSCGMMKGYQLSDWQQVQQNESFVDIRASGVRQQLQDLDQFYISVVVRSQLTGLTTMYPASQTTWDAMEDYQSIDDQNNENEKDQTGLIVGVTVAVVVVICIVIGVVFYIKKKKAGNPYAFSTGKEQEVKDNKPTIQI